MSGALAWVLVALGLGVVGVRRRSVAVALLTVQALVLAGVALNDAASGGDVVAAAALACGRSASQRCSSSWSGARASRDPSAPLPPHW